MAESRMQGDVLLIGSLPFHDVETVYRETGPSLRGYASALPDGEVGVRTSWVGMLPVEVFSKNDQLEETVAPPDHTLAQGERRGEPVPVQDLPAFWAYRVKPGENLRFDDVAYGRFARDSYEIFHRMRDEGVIDPGVRFQLCLPAPDSAIESFFDDASQWPAVKRAYLDRLRREIDSLLKTIPPSDLAVQFDLAWEVVDLAMGERNFFNFWPKQSLEEKYARHVAQLDDVWQGIPDETILGYHWCYGTWGGWPMTAMEDVSICVRLSNEAVKRAGRRVDYVHMPVTRQPDSNFFAPLKNLNIGDTKVFLGMVHHDDGMDNFRERVRLARQFLPSFGIAGVCGYGRVEPDQLQEVLRVHRACADELQKS